MADFAVVLCSQNNENVKENSLSLLSNKIRSIFKSKGVQLKVNEIELDKDLNMHIIKLRNSVTGLLNLKEKQLNEVFKSITEVLKKKSIRTCIIPEEYPDVFQSIGCIKRKFSGQYLYMSLILLMINDMLSSNGRELNNLEIAIIKGSDENRLFALIHLLLPKIKYLTVIAQKEELLERNINEICFTTGLSIRLTADTKNAIKDIDLLINLNNSFEFKPTYKLKSNAVILNFDDAIANWASVENVIINKIDVGLPSILKNKIDADILKFFSSVELSEIILIHKYNLEDKVIEGIYDYEDMKVLANTFKKDGYKIEGFFGRRGLLKKIV